MHKIHPADTARIYKSWLLSRQYESKDPALALKFAGEGLLLSRQVQYEPGLARLFAQVALLNTKYQRWDVAIRYQQEALSTYVLLHDELSVASADLTLASYREKLQQWNLAEGLVKKGLKLYLHYHRQADVSRCYQHLGHISDLQGHTQAALDYYLQAQQLQSKTAVTHSALSLLKNLSNTYNRLGDHQRALAYLQQGVEKTDTLPLARMHIHFLRKAANLHDSLGNSQQALSLHKQALAKAKQYRLPEEEAKALIGIAKTIQQQDAGQSIDHLNKALMIARQLKSKSLAAEIYHSLSDIYRQHERFKDALFALEQHNQLLDSLLIVNQMHETAIMKENYALESSKARIEYLELQSTKRTYERNIGIIGIVAVTLILIGGWFYLDKTKKLNKNLAESNQVKDRLFSIIGHDLRNPVGGITQMLSLLEEEPLEEDHQEIVTAMRKQGQVASDILDSLLNWGKAQLQGIDVKRVNFEAKPIVCKNIDLLNKQSEDKCIVIENAVPEGLTIWGDADHFNFIVRNLLSNAIKFSYKQGKITLKADTQSRAGNVIFSVQDEGKGIDAAQQKQFNSGNMEVAYGTGGEKGTGIGLALSKEFIKANSGSIWLKSDIGAGTTFYFSYPVAAQQD